MNRQEANKQILEMYNDSTYHELKAYYEKTTIFNVLGVERSETRHSAFLCWLLLCAGHGWLVLYQECAASPVPRRPWIGLPQPRRALPERRRCDDHLSPPAADGTVAAPSGHTDSRRYVGDGRFADAGIACRTTAAADAYTLTADIAVVVPIIVLPT